MRTYRHTPLHYCLGTDEKGDSITGHDVHGLPIRSDRQLPPLSFTGAPHELKARETYGYLGRRPSRYVLPDAMERSKTYPAAEPQRTREPVRLPSYTALERNVADNIEDRWGTPNVESPSTYRGTWRESYHSRERGEYLRARGLAGTPNRAGLDWNHHPGGHFRSSELDGRFQPFSRSLAPWSSFQPHSKYNVYMRPTARHNSYPSRDNREWSDRSWHVPATGNLSSSPVSVQRVLPDEHPTNSYPTTQTHATHEPYLRDNKAPTIPNSKPRDEGPPSPTRRTETNQYPRRRGKLPKAVIEHLKTWLLEHADHPYPTEEEKRGFCECTGLDISQVSNWFVNARRRILVPQQNAAKAESITSTSL